jgi:SWI/SNF-related matrix-associated actin-dependent regulator 1 of chromatin subfamily A
VQEPLFPYQIEGAKWLASRSLALLADEMGLGKSAQVVRASDILDLKKILIICPAVARVNWLREFQKFSTTSRNFDLVLNGKSKVTPGSSVICSYDLIATTSLPGPWDALVVDESHFMKSLEAKRTKAILGRDGIVRQAKRVWALSGTPAPNHAGELWPILYTFGATPLLYDKFVTKYCDSYSPRYNQVQITGTKPAMIPEIRNLLSTVMLRRRKEDVMKELPPICFDDIVVEPGPVDLDTESSFIQYVYPNDRRKELEQKLKKEKKIVESIAGAAGFGKDGMKALEAMAQSVSTLRRYTGLQKVASTAELLASELESNAYEKLVIFAIHRDVIEGLRLKLKDFKPVTLYGGTSPESRQKHIDKFQNNPRCRVFIANIQAAGTAITLTAAHTVVFIEQDWVPGNNAQAAMRCHRIGQTKPVNVRFVGLADSIDEKISQVLKRKTRQLSAIFDGPVLQNAKQGASPDKSMLENLEGVSFDSILND